MPLISCQFIISCTCNICGVN